MNIYFNSCFTQTAEAIRLLKQKDNELKVFITNKNDNIYLKEVSDYYEIEKEYLSDKEYLNFCLDFCTKHDIDIFFIRYRATELARYKEEFENIGVKVTFITDYNTYKLLDNKVHTYDSIKKENIIAIPPYGVANNYKEYIELYDYIKKEGFSVCIKPIEGVGGIGFKRISENISAYDEIKSNSSSLISKERADFVFKEKGLFEPIMMLGYLEGQEYSIDCLANEGTLIDAIPRIKIDAYTQSIIPNENLFEIADKITRKFNLSNIFNIQVKYHKGKIYLIEINTRMSGGVFKSCMSGINIVYKNIKLLDNQDVLSENHLLKEIKINQINECAIYNI